MRRLISPLMILAACCVLLAGVQAQAQAPAAISAWTTQTDILHPEGGSSIPMQMAGAAAIDNFIFLLGGNINGGADADTVWRWQVDQYAGTLGTATAGVALPTADNYAYINAQVAVSTDTRTIYIAGGGYNGTGPNRNNVTYAKVDSTGVLPTGGWTQSTAFPTPYDPELGFATVCNGYLYCGGGDSQSGTPVTYDTCVYAKVNSDGSLGTWSAGTTLPGSSWFGSAVSVGNYIIFAMGIKNTPGTNTASQPYLYATNEVYVCQTGSNGAMGSWVASSALPAKRYGMGMVAVGNTIFAIGGRDDTAALTSTVYRATFNPATGTLGAWESADAALPAGVRYHDVVYNTVSKRIYVVGIRAAAGITNEGYISNQLFVVPTPVPTSTPVPTVPPSGAQKSWEKYR